MKTTQPTQSAPFVATSGRKLARFDLLKHMIEPRPPELRVESSSTCKSRGRDFLLREVGLFTNIHRNDDPHTSSLRLLGRESLLRSIALNDVTIILGETGSGKTTRMSPRSSLPWSHPGS